MVLPLLAAGLVFVVLFTLAVLSGTRLAGRFMGRRVNAMHHDMEELLETGLIPRAWRINPPQGGNREGNWQACQKAQAMRGLRALCRYVETTPCIADVETREHLLGEFGRIEEHWRQTPTAALCAPIVVLTEPDVGGKADD